MANSYNPNTNAGQPTHTAPNQMNNVPPPPKENPYGKKILLGLVIATVLSIILIGLGGNTAGFVANVGASLFLGITVTVLILDGKGFVSLRGWIKWHHMERNQKIGMGCLFFFVFPLMLCIYLVRACFASFQGASATRLAPQNNRAKRGIIIGSVVTLVFLVSTVGTYATGTHPTADTAIARTPQQNTAVPTAKPTVVPTPKPTVAPTATPTSLPTPTSAPQPTQPPTGVNGNPWGYDFTPGNLIYHPPSTFCDYFNCIPSFWTSTNGYVDECNDGTYSHSGGVSGACSKHGGEMRPLYSH